MSISEPFLLASYNSHLYASANLHNASLAVQSDGVHVIELSTLRPIISHTLGPSTSFACSPLTVSDGHIHTIYAPIQSSSELSDEQEHGRTIWVWREDLSSTIADRAEAHKKKVSVTVPHTIAGLFYAPELSNKIIALSPGGAITTLNSEDLKKQKTWICQVDGAGRSLLKSFVYPRSGCSFLSPVETPRNGVVLVLLLADPTTSDTRVETVFITSEDKESPFVLASSYRINITQNEILDVSCSSTGHLSILSALIPPQKRVALLPLTSTHVLLAGISSSSTEIVIHIWDLQYSVLLVSHILSIPSSISSFSPQTISITLLPSLPAASSQAALIDSQALLISIFLFLPVPYVVPRASTIANAMGRASVSAQWIAPREDDERNEIDDDVMYSGMDKSRKEVLKEMSDAMEGKRPQAANDAFFKWENSQATDKPLVFGHDFVKQVLDVASIGLAMQNVMDITESEIVEALYHIVRACEEQRNPHDPEAMEVDPGNSSNVTSARKDTPTVPSFLGCCVNYRITPPQLRLALREQHSTAPEHALVILRILIDWLQVWRNRDVMLSSGNKEQCERSQVKNGTNEVPELQKIVSFTQAYLDATSLILVQHPPAQEVLRQLASSLEPEIQFTEAVQPLCGALDEFARAHRKALRDAEDKGVSNVKGVSAGM
ncbi:hypothetical protein F5887DRAFT_965799 [Amanita rubescens]|nr:hypothetical protein F5887DRAFT_965799 [Amanita rubescens]